MALIRALFLVNVKKEYCFSNGAYDGNPKYTFATCAAFECPDPDPRYTYIIYTMSRNIITLFRLIVKSNDSYISGHSGI